MRNTIVYGTISTRPAARIALLAACALASACAKPPSHGEADALIIGASPELWDQVEDMFTQALEPTFQAVRDERPFDLTYQDPAFAPWGTLRQFRQVVLLGTPSSPWIAEALAEGEPAESAAGAPPESVPAIHQVNNVWARPQVVSMVLLPETDPAGAVAGLARELQLLLNDQYREYALERMFASGENTALADSLLADVGFSFIFPTIYRLEARDSVYRFRNDNPSPAELIREVAVTWRTPLPEADPSREDLEAWRVEFAETSYNDPQLLDTTVATYGPMSVGGLQGVEFQSAWVSPPDAWPAGGPFITRAIRCPAQNRMYLVDAWLYAPNRDKYEYMIQLETILDSFRCGA